MHGIEIIYTLICIKNHVLLCSYSMLSTRALKEGVITVVIETYAIHLDRQIAIQGARSNAFYNASQRASSERFIKDRTAAICLKLFTMDRLIVTIDINNWTVAPKTCINRDVLLISKAFESKSIQLIILDTNTFESLDPIFIYAHFRTFGGFEIDIWPSREREIEA